jgi:hypothetical protein
MTDYITSQRVDNVALFDSDEVAALACHFTTTTNTYYFYSFKWYMLPVPDPGQRIKE